MKHSHRWAAVALPGVLALTVGLGVTPTAHTTAQAVAPPAPHIMVIIDENAAYDSSLGSPYIVDNTKDAPYIHNTLIPTYTSATKWYSVEHVSSYDYYDLISGADQKGLSKPYLGTTFVDQLAAKGISWKAYIESMPSTCYTGGGNGVYDPGHNPFIAFKSIVKNPAQCNNDVPMTSMTTDLNKASPPSFVWVSPNQCDNMHSNCSPTNNKVTQGDTWLSTTIPAVKATNWYKNGGIIIVTWDESVVADTTHPSGTTDSGGHVATIVISAANNSPYSNPGDHFGTLNGLETAYGVGCLTPSAPYCDSKHGDISGAFAASGPGSITGTVINANTTAPVDGVTVTCSVCTPTTTTTAGGGLYTLSNAPPGSDSVTFSDTGYVSQTVSVSVSSGAQATESPALVPDGSIAGTVNNANTTAPVDGVTVTCSVCTPTTTTTAGGGNYTLSNAPPGSDSVTFSDTGYVSQTVSVSVTAGAQATKDAALAPTQQFIFGDGFESGDFSAWTSSSGLTVQSTTFHAGSFAAQGIISSAAGDARKTLPSTYNTAYERVWFRLASQSTQVYLLQANTAANSAIAIVYSNSSGLLGLQAADGSRHDSTTAVTANAWHELEVRVTVSGTTSSADVWLDNMSTPVLSLTNINLKTTAVGAMQVGDATSHTWNAVFDDAAFDINPIP